MKRFIVCLMGVILGLWIAAPAISVVWSAAGFDSTPVVGDPVSEGDDRIRELKEEIRYRAEVEHWWADDPDGESNDNGLHRLGSGRCYVGTTAPTELADSHSGIGAGNLADYDNTTDTSMSGENTLAGAATNSAAANEDDVGHGRCWLDTDGPDDDILTLSDNNKMWVYVGGTGWVDTVWASVRPEGDDEVLAGAYNLVYNGSFEAADGDGDETSTTVPAGWADGGVVCVHNYNDPSTDDDFGDGYEYQCDGAGGASALITQTLTNLAANQTYKVMARAMDDGTTVCRLSTSGAGVESGNIDTTTDVWETLSGTFTTGAALDTVIIQLTRVTDNQQCLWDHVVVYQIDDIDTDRDEISQPGAYKVRNQYAGATITCNNTEGGAGNCAAAATGLRVNVTPASPGSIIMLYGSVIVRSHANTEDCHVRLWNGAAILAEAFSDDQYHDTLFLQHTIVNPVVGTTLVLDLDVWAVPTLNCDLDDEKISYLEAVVIPTR